MKGVGKEYRRKGGKDEGMKENKKNMKGGEE
jgi:hypothetical protein